MFRAALTAVLFCFTATVFAGKPAPKPACPAWLVPVAHYFADLRHAENDKVSVRMVVPEQDERTVIFCMPKIVPGIYGGMNFGKLVENIHALDWQGNEMKIVRIDENRWKIRHAKRLHVITYDVNDGWDAFDGSSSDIYLSASSTFKQNEVFLLNHNALFGYLEGYKDVEVVVHIAKPAGLSAATVLRQTAASDTLDSFYAADYNQLVDQPILYTRGAITTFNLQDVQVGIALYSSTNRELAPDIAGYLQPLMEHQQHYLGGELPVSSYMFLLYHHEHDDFNSWSWDGLEHSSSTVILMNTAYDPELIKRNIYSVAAHEFFHTIVPLGLHSEEIAFYGYNDPKMSQHLWLYEGLTEYFTIHMPVMEKLASADQFLAAVQEKIDNSRSFAHKKSLTYLSKNALKYPDQYMDFYQKGALLNLCLDIRLRELSGGAYGVQQMTVDLMKEYGISRAFEDDQLFDEIARVSTQPEIRAFFKRYAEGTAPLPLKEMLEKVGIAYDETTERISWLPQPTAQQQQMRKAWIGI